MRGVQDAIRSLQALRISRLSVDAGGGFRKRHPSMLHETGDALLSWGVHNDHGIEFVNSTRFNEQRHCINQRDIRVFALVRRKSLSGESMHLWVNDAVEALSRFAIVKDLLRQMRAVELPIIGEDFGAERLHNPRKTRRAWCDSVAGENVSVNYGDAVGP